MAGMAGDWRFAGGALVSLPPVEAVTNGSGQPVRLQPATGSQLVEA